VQAEFEQSIIEDLALLGIKADATSYTSDYFDTLQQMAVQLIKDGKAYADDTEQEKVRARRAGPSLLSVAGIRLPPPLPLLLLNIGSRDFVLPRNC
jgi:hypothetical protein